MSETTWSYDEETFGLDSKEEAIISFYESLYYSLTHPNQFPQFLVGQAVYFGTGYQPKASDFIDAGRITEDMSERAYDEHGEWAEDFPNCSVESFNELDRLVKDWADKHCPVTFYGVKDVEPYTITQEDVEELFYPNGELK